MILEICCGDLASVLAARKGGAERIELCSGLAEGGLTPSFGLITAAVEAGIEKINVLIRPRPGDFLYSENELLMMQADIRTAIEAGASGIVIGVLTPDGEVDSRACQMLIDAACLAAEAIGRPKPDITFHRAFDVSDNATENLEKIIALGCDSLLTSGMAPSAAKGLPLLQKLSSLAAGRIKIIVGAGINAGNAADIIAASGVDGIHSTARKPIPSRMRFRRPLVAMGAPGSDEYAPLATSPDVVANLLKITSSF